MKKYRIVEHKHLDGGNFVLQKKSIFGVWYNPDNIDAYTTGWFDSLNEAIKAIERKIAPVQKTVIYSRAV